MSRLVPLSPQEAADLQQFGLTATEEACPLADPQPSPASPPSAPITAAAFLEQENCLIYLDELAARLGTDSRPIAASMLAKRYAALSAVPFFYALTCYDRALELPLHAVLLRVGEGAGVPWLKGLSVCGELFATSPAGRTRELWRLEAAERYLRLHLTPLWQALSRYSGLPETILWENTAVRIYSLYEKKLPAAVGQVGAARIAEDLHFLLKELSAEAFGQRRQPLAFFYGAEGETGAAPESESPQPRVRKTCCLYHRVSAKADFCTACPKVTHPANTWQLAAEAGEVRQSKTDTASQICKRDDA
ncbi:IucA/IucC family C-terminal-domain containing protein [Paenibacillus sanguinis]|uniref:IucA/IucC family C-terminal-domain containing protein n=1 Tax=Paenibacillus sanguinis TaxID=225906 RepID=UPI00059334CB|nr:IucA/IucC family C-terminal-domain containing protein [Paenibacillus sanguinis]